METIDLLRLVTRRPFGRPVYDIIPKGISIDDVRSDLEHLAAEGLVESGAGGIGYPRLTAKGSEALYGGESD